MSSEAFDQLVEQARALPPQEQLQLRDLLNSWLNTDEERAQDEWEQEMVRQGVLSVPPPITDFTPYQNRKPIEIPGKPLSETIIEERR